MNRILSIFIFFVLCKTNLGALTNGSKTKIDLLAEKVRIEQKTFPQGDLKDVGYVKAIINRMYLLDQELRQVFAQDFDNLEVQGLVAHVDEFHTVKMKQILLQHGWINISKFGHEADRQAWLLVQHADQDLFFRLAVYLFWVV